MSKSVTVNVFKNQLRKAYAYYPLAQIEKAEWHKKEIIKTIKNLIMDSASSGIAEMTDEFRASWLPFVLEFCKDNDLQIETTELPTQVNESRFKVRIWGWADDEETSGVQASLRT